MSHCFVVQKNNITKDARYARRASARARRRYGGSLVEAGAAMALLLPVLMIMMWVITEVSQYFVLKQQLAFVARQAARELSYAYGTLGYTSMNTGGVGSGAANTGDSNYFANSKCYFSAGHYQC